MALSSIELHKISIDNDFGQRPPAYQWAIYLNHPNSSNFDDDSTLHLLYLNGSYWVSKGDKRERALGIQ